MLIQNGQRFKIKLPYDKIELTVDIYVILHIYVCIYIFAYMLAYLCCKLTLLYVTSGIHFGAYFSCILMNVFTRN